MNPETAWTVSSLVTLIIGLVATGALFGIVIKLYTKDGQD